MRNRLVFIRNEIVPTFHSTTFRKSYLYTFGFTYTHVVFTRLATTSLREADSKHRAFHGNSFFFYFVQFFYIL